MFPNYTGKLVTIMWMGIVAAILSRFCSLNTLSPLVSIHFDSFYSKKYKPYKSRAYVDGRFIFGKIRAVLPLILYA